MDERMSGMHYTTIPLPDGQVVLTSVMPERLLQPALESLASLEADGVFEPLKPAEAVARYRNAWGAIKWTPADRDRLEWVLDGTHGGLRQFVTELAMTDELLTGEELASRSGFPSGNSLKSALPHLATRCRRVERRPLWWVPEKRDGLSLYAMHPEVRSLVRAVLALGDSET